MALGSEDHGLRLPNPPPLLHTRAQFDRPGTPDAFTSPPQTPQGSPSKSRLPPGALDLPNVFDKAMKLTPNTPKPTYNHYNHPMFSADKSDISVNENVIHQTPPSPTRRSNKENTPPNSARLTKDLGAAPAAAALSRQEPYQQRDQTTKRQVQMRGLTPEEIEKLAQPKVKRLVNVTQLCAFLQSLPVDSC